MHNPDQRSEDRPGADPAVPADLANHEAERQLLQQLHDADAAWLRELSTLATSHEPPSPAPGRRRPTT